MIHQLSLPIILLPPNLLVLLLPQLLFCDDAFSLEWSTSDKSPYISGQCDWTRRRRVASPYLSLPYPGDFLDCFLDRDNLLSWSHSYTFTYFPPTFLGRLARILCLALQPYLVGRMANQKRECLPTYGSPSGKRGT